MIDNTNIYIFLLILVRMSTFIIVAPIFSSRGIPAYIKIGLALFLSLLILPVISINRTMSLDGNYIIYVIEEAMIGLSIGFMGQLIFTAIQVAGSFIDLQVGFALANVIDPQTGIQSPITGNFKYTFAVLLFLVLNIHHLFIGAIISSFHTLPITGEWFSKINSEPIMMLVVATFSQMFVLAFKIAAPIIITLLLTDIALGIVARTVPQLNVFVVGMPLKIFILYFIFIIIASGLIYIFKDLFGAMIASIKQFIDLMG